MVNRKSRQSDPAQLVDGEETVTEPTEIATATLEDARAHARAQAGVAALTGEIRQRPSSVSAIKVDGVRSYSRVRGGEEVELPERPVTVSRFEVLAVRRVELVDRAIDVDVEVTVSSGTYVRALTRDLGAALGGGGHLTALRRTRVGGFTLAQAHTVEALEAARAAGEPRREDGAGGGLDSFSDFLGRQQIHDAAFSLASRRARALTTPSMMASGRGEHPGTYISTGMTWSTGPTRV